MKRFEGETGKSLLDGGGGATGDEEDEHDDGQNDAVFGSLIARTETRKPSLSRDELVKLALDGCGCSC